MMALLTINPFQFFQNEAPYDENLVKIGKYKNNFGSRDLYCTCHGSIYHELQSNMPYSSRNSTSQSVKLYKYLPLPTVLVLRS